MPTVMKWEFASFQSEFYWKCKEDTVFVPVRSHLVREQMVQMPKLKEHAENIPEAEERWLTVTLHFAQIHGK